MVPLRKRIRQLARGKFEYDKPVLSFEEDAIELEVIQDADYSGSFTIKSDNHLFHESADGMSDPAV